ncbi:MAG TPA: glutaredoxin family protein [Rudaea sp.]
MKRTAFLIATMILVCTIPQTYAGNTVYKSVGPDGSIVYSDHPPADGRVEKTFEFADLPSSPVPDIQPPPLAPKPEARKPQRVAPAGTTLFSATWCGYCKRAKAYLERNGIGYRNIDIDTPDGRAQFNNAGGGGIPLLFSGGHMIRGFTADGYKRFFDAGN